MKKYLYLLAISIWPFIGKAQYRIPDAVALKEVRANLDNEKVSYQHRANDDRWEGLITTQTAGPSAIFTLLSLTKGPVTFKTRPNDKITVASPNLPFVWVTARNIEDPDHPIDYRLDLVTENGSVCRVPETIIAAYKLNQDNLCFAGFKYEPNAPSDQDTRIYVPININFTSESTINVTLISNSQVVHVQAQLTDDATGNTFAASPKIINGDNSFDSDQTIRFIIPTKKFVVGHTYTIKFTANVNKRQLTKKITFEYLN
ncbi:hypothetical protein HDF19_21010 [Mucilaginibacter sp. E4BP6]|uniref:hypothetical protein n=1 Tax=Mucilaginibacter sp. E4BP6 TaxID=2723089 RepID=UPI0015C6C5CF|nr:hypothetical protein [Mucilaginibacter sp. E4BP6]NYE68160.1 hypothetical protein [Mucilaginibacter sp. E4BP6]